MEIAEFSISDLVSALRRNKFKVAFCFVLILGSTFALNVVLPRAYESEAQLMIRLGRENATLDPTTTLGEASTISLTQTREFETNSVAMMLSSRALVERVVDNVGPKTILSDGEPEAADEPKAAAGFAARIAAAKQWMDARVPSHEEIGLRDQAIRKLQKGLRVQAVAKTNLIRVTYQSRDPDLSQSVVSSVIENYGVEHVRIYRAPGANEFLEDQKQHLGDELSRAENELVELKDQTGLVDPAEQRKVLVGRLGVLNSELFAVEAVLVEAQTEFDDLNELLAALSREGTAVGQDGATSEVSDAMRSQLYQLQLEAQNSLASYSEDHVKARQLRKQISAGKNILIREETLLGIQKLKPLLRAQQAKAEKLSEQIAQIEDELRQLNKNEMLVSRLQRRVELRDATFRQVSADAEQSRIDHSLELAKITNISVVQPATRDPYPVFPNTRLNLVVAFLVAMFVSPGLAVFSESWKATIASNHRRRDASAANVASPAAVARPAAAPVASPAAVARPAAVASPAPVASPAAAEAIQSPEQIAFSKPR